jgi:hypothetical protein
MTTAQKSQRDEGAGAEREQQGDGVEAERAPGFPLAVGGVQRAEELRRGRRPAPEGADGRGQASAGSEAAARPGGQAAQEFGHDLGRARRQRAWSRVPQALGQRRRIDEEAAEPHERRERREEREEAVERHGRRFAQQAPLEHPEAGPAQHLAPAARGDGGRGGGAASLARSDRRDGSGACAVCPRSRFVSMVPCNNA